MAEDEVYDVIPLEPRFESLCSTCHLVYPRAIGCECDEWAPVAPVIPLRVAA